MFASVKADAWMVGQLGGWVAGWLSGRVVRCFGGWALSRSGRDVGADSSKPNFKNKSFPFPHNSWKNSFSSFPANFWRYTEREINPWKETIRVLCIPKEICSIFNAFLIRIISSTNGAQWIHNELTINLSKHRATRIYDGSQVLLSTRVWVSASPKMGIVLCIVLESLMRQVCAYARLLQAILMILTCAQIYTFLFFMRRRT